MYCSHYYLTKVSIVVALTFLLQLVLGLQFALHFLQTTNETRQIGSSWVTRNACNPIVDVTYDLLDCAQYLRKLYDPWKNLKTKSLISVD